MSSELIIGPGPGPGPELDNKRITDLSIKQADSILSLHTRLNHLEKEGTLEGDDQTKSNEQVDEKVNDVSNKESDLEFVIQCTTNNYPLLRKNSSRNVQMKVRNMWITSEAM